MTPLLIQEAGTHVFTASYDKVYAATLSALKMEGYPIASSDAEKGSIETGQKVIQGPITRQYIVRVRKSAEGITISAEPHIFRGSTELTDQPIWYIDTPEGERALWQRLFRDIEHTL